MVPPARHFELYLPTPVWWYDACEPAWNFAVPTFPYSAYNSFLLKSCTSNAYTRNNLFAEHCTLTFCALIESCRFGVPASFRQDPHMQLDKDHNLDVLYAVLLQMREFIEHREKICLLKCISVDSAVKFLATCRSMTVDWSAHG